MRPAGSDEPDRILSLPGRVSPHPYPLPIMADSKRILIAQTEFKPGGVLDGITGSGKGGRVMPGDVIEVTADSEQDKALRGKNLAVPAYDGLRLQRAVLTPDGDDFTHNFHRPEGIPDGVLLLRRGQDGGPPSDDKAVFDVVGPDGIVTNTRTGLSNAVSVASEIEPAPAPGPVAAPASSPKPTKSAMKPE